MGTSFILYDGFKKLNQTIFTIFLFRNVSIYFDKQSTKRESTENKTTFSNQFSTNSVYLFFSLACETNFFCSLSFCGWNLSKWGQHPREEVVAFDGNHWLESVDWTFIISFFEWIFFLPLQMNRFFAIIFFNYASLILKIYCWEKSWKFFDR